MPRANVRPALKASSWRKVPGYARAIMITQFAIIVYLATSMYLEYLNNIYLQSYLKTFLQSNMPGLLTIIPVTLAIGTVTVYARLLTREKQFQEESYSKVALQPLRMPTPVIPYPGEVKAPQPRDYIRQFTRFLAPSSPRRVSRNESGAAGMGSRRNRKRMREPTVSEP